MEFDLSYVARLARVTLTQEEINRFKAQLGKILEYIQVLNRLDTKETPPTTHPLPLTNVFREDVPQVSLKSEEVLKDAPQAKGSAFVVPKIIEQA